MTCPAEEVFFGGARGGGKTDGVLGKWGLKAMEYGHHFNARFFRRTLVSAEDAIERSKQIFEPLGARFADNPPRWRFRNNARVQFGYLDSVADAEHQQGKNLTDVWIEEAGQYPDAAPIDRLFGAMRSPAGIPIQMILTANPGGAGQSWLRDRYRLSPLPKRPIVVERARSDGGMVKVAVIPSRIQDNRILLANDPKYIERLRLVGNEALVQAWLDGDWSAIEGAFFSEWNEGLVIAPFQIPENWIRFRSYDWGFAKPFSIGWWAHATDNTVPGVEQGAIVRYREWYGAEKPNVGLRLTAEEITAGIREREDSGERIDYSVADPAIFSEDGGPSIAERSLPIAWQKADNRRVGTLGHVGGWDQMRARMRDRKLLVFETCMDFRRLIPMQQHDLKKPEDLDSDGEDHCPDEVRYACMSRPYTPRPPKPQGVIETPSLQPRAERMPKRRRGRRKAA